MGAGGIGKMRALNSLTFSWRIRLGRKKINLSRIEFYQSKVILKVGSTNLKSIVNSMIKK